MKIHHLDCGSMRRIEADGLAPAHVVNHCLLVETATDGLVLVETGIGLDNIRSPAETLDVDHCGGLPDFPGAQVHVLADELEAAIAEAPASATGRPTGHTARNGCPTPPNRTRSGSASPRSSRAGCPRRSN